MLVELKFGLIKKNKIKAIIRIAEIQYSGTSRNNIYIL
jgi:hypothetical protein